MARIVISVNLTLDGVVQDPVGEEGFAHGGWFARMGDRNREAWNRMELDEALASEAMLFGRRTYDAFAERWPGRTGQLADRWNGMPKYLVSSRPEEPGWNNTTALRGDAAAEVAKLKRALSGDIVVYGSFRLVRPLMERRLVDELRLIVYPVVIGDGERFFDGVGHNDAMRLVTARPLGEGLAYLAYRT